ncbi:GFA family protein [Caballeronia sp. LZ035]|uniref:GFA family protein n=1 Tax=Caballeronia sp. LZ035 TaxID=3038568 RepID=UPI0028628C70|nr:GFA family protein [Caballeronia sp. LZ035]MDR5759225.1 GFA family protein [Caballeronia sp. LZ035]
MKVEGQCHCGAIAYEAEVTPGTVAICHCADCQTLTGSAFRVNIAAPAETFRILKGKPKRYLKTADSGARRIHAFCAECGGPVYSSAEENPSSYSLRVGALKQRYELGAPKRQSWTQRRFDWLSGLGSAEAFEGQP